MFNEELFEKKCNKLSLELEKKEETMARSYDINKFRVNSGGSLKHKICTEPDKNLVINYLKNYQNSLTEIVWRNFEKYMEMLAIIEMHYGVHMAFSSVNETQAKKKEESDRRNKRSEMIRNKRDLYEKALEDALTANLIFTDESMINDEQMENIRKIYIIEKSRLAMAKLGEISENFSEYSMSGGTNVLEKYGIVRIKEFPDELDETTFLSYFIDFYNKEVSDYKLNETDFPYLASIQTELTNKRFKRFKRFINLYAFEKEHLNKGGERFDKFPEYMYEYKHWEIE